MKKNLIVLSLLISFLGYSQVTFGNSFSGGNMGTALFKDKVFDMENKNKDIQGSAYIYQDFVDGSIENVGGILKIRYNALKDDVEIQQEGSVYVIPREEKFSKINITKTGETIKLEKFTFEGKPYEGYLFEIANNGNVSVYKKEKVNFQDFEKARSTYAEDKPARFVTEKPLYYIKLNDGKIVDLPKSKKKLIELLPDKKSQIESYFKNNKVDFGKDQDLKALFRGI